jgi:hypothetical protein
MTTAGPSLVMALANALQQNNYDGSFDDRKTPRVSAPDVDASTTLSSKKSKKKKSKKQAQKAKAAYKLRRKEGHELRSNSSSSGELVREGSSYHGSGNALGTFSTEDINAPLFNDGVETLSTSDDDSFSHHQDQFIQNNRKSITISSIEVRKQADVQIHKKANITPTAPEYAFRHRNYH